MKNKFLSLLTTSLALGTVSPPQLDALDMWADKYLPELSEQAKNLLRGPFDFGEVGELAESAVQAAQELKGIFKGVPRARIAQAVLVTTAKAALPESWATRQVKHWVLPLLEGPALEALIEAAFQRVFGAEAQAAPVVDASDVPAGGVQ